MKFGSLLLILLTVAGARGEPAIQVELEWLNHVEMKCESCSTQSITIQSGDWCIIGALCGGGRVFVKIVARWQGDAIEVSLTRQTRVDDEKFADEGASESVTVRDAEVKQLELRGFKYAISTRAAPERESDRRK